MIGAVTHLKAFWKETIDFLTMHEIPITAAVMMQVQEIEDGSPELLDFIDDDALRKWRQPVMKQEQWHTSQDIGFLPKCTKPGHTTKGDLEVKSSLVKIEVEELLSSSGMVPTTDIVTIRDGISTVGVEGDYNRSTCFPQEELNNYLGISQTNLD
jgi:hypothetical protein